MTQAACNERLNNAGHLITIITIPTDKKKKCGRVFNSHFGQPSFFSSLHRWMHRCHKRGVLCLPEVVCSASARLAAVKFLSASRAVINKDSARNEYISCCIDVAILPSLSAFNPYFVSVLFLSSIPKNFFHVLYEEPKPIGFRRQVRGSR